jgi:hypothetical protein
MTARTCTICGQPYRLASFRLDSGACSSCRPQRFALVWPHGPDTTRSIWHAVSAFHLVYLFLLLIILSTDLTGAAIYSLAVAAYCLVRMAIGRIRGYPTLTRRQEIVLLFVPIWGPVVVAQLVAGLQAVYQVTGIMPYLEKW